MSSATNLDHITISALYWEARASFHRLFDFLQPPVEVRTSLPDDFGRLKVLVENMGAHRRGMASLDYRLREAESVREMLKGLMMDLNTTLEEGGLLLA
jgi:hypothetical protein